MCSEIVQQNLLIKIWQLKQVRIFPVFGLIEESIEVIPDELWIHCETISPERVIQFLTKIKPSSKEQYQIKMPTLCMQIMSYDTTQ